MGLWEPFAFLPVMRGFYTKVECLDGEQPPLPQSLDVLLVRRQPWRRVDITFPGEISDISWAR